jgi:branched-chain amino acid transport system ATP-binding protein
LSYVVGASKRKDAMATQIPDLVYVMGDRRIVFEGTPAELKADANIRKEWLEV